MNVLIVDKDKNFAKVMSKKLKTDKNVLKINYYSNFENSYSTLQEKSEVYSLGIIDLDTVQTFDFLMNDNTKYVVYSSNNRTLNKYINNPSIQRVFHKPFNLSCFFKYLSKYCGILENDKFEKEKTLDILLKIGFSRSWQGTTYLAEAIDLAISGKTKSPKDLYNILAKKYDTNSSKIFWSINNSINRMVNSDYLNKHQEFFEIYDGRKPTPKFIVDFFVAKYGENSK